jgi:sulfoxide reductase catalytic subunit YedY
VILILFSYYWRIKVAFIFINEDSMANEYQDSVTPEKLYFSRRKFLKLAGAVGVTAALAACGIKPGTITPAATAVPYSGTPVNTLMPGDTLTPYDLVTSYNNFYEFSLNKQDVAQKAVNFVSSPWPFTVGGLVDHPLSLDVSELMKMYPAEERIYRMRCVEGWSMVIPWLGFPLNKLLQDVGVQSGAKYVKFTTLYNHDFFPNDGAYGFAWPYTEGLRLDEAQQDLTLLATGLYGKPLPPQDGAPIRLVVPWKYGFKSVKSINGIELVEEQPKTFWMSAAETEYGFYANVNPAVPHPRWAQDTERRIGETDRRPTELFNGYSEVAPLYAGMDLVQNF